MQKSAANVDDGMRIINRLIAALSELLSKKSISGILHTCATLGEKEKKWKLLKNFFVQIFLYKHQLNLILFDSYVVLV